MIDFWISRDVVDFRLLHRFAGDGTDGGLYQRSTSCKLCCLLLFLWFVFLVPEWKLGVVRHYWLDLCVWFVEGKRREVPRDYYSVLSHHGYSCNLI